jgi:hypothetical protein
MIGKIRELFAKIDHHTDLFDEFAEKVEGAINSVKRHYGY